MLYVIRCTVVVGTFGLLACRVGESGRSTLGTDAAFTDGAADAAGTTGDAADASTGSNPEPSSTGDDETGPPIGTQTSSGAGDASTGDEGLGACPSQGVGGAKGEHAIAVGDYPPSMVYVPDAYDGSVPAPLVVSLHGAGDNAPNFNEWWKEAANAEGIVVLTAESSTGPGGGWDPSVDDGMLAASIQEMEDLYNIDTCRRFIAGFSNGGHYAYMYGLAHADEFAGIGVHAGSLQFAAGAGIWPDNVPRTIAVDIHHGTADPVIPFGHGTDARDALEARGHTVYFAPLEGVGHTIARAYANEMWANLGGHTNLD